ncbi:MAG: DMT family transporter [Aquabacterium sp.]
MTGTSPGMRALQWTVAAGLIFCLLNTLMRTLTQQMHPLQAQLLRYLFGLLVLLPLVLRHGIKIYMPNSIPGQLWRGAAHTVGLMLWFSALPMIPLADMTALGFTGPIFIMIGAWLFLGERMRWDRWAATLFSFAGVLIVVGPKLSGDGGWYHLVMLASAPMFAASFLLTKALTRNESNNTILIWQHLTVTLFSLPLALPVWQAVNAWQWLGFVACGLLGVSSHWCMTQGLRLADISATQSVKFLDLIWASLAGWLVFAQHPTQSTLIGGVVICAATLWLARRESHAGAVARARPAT